MFLMRILPGVLKEVLMHVPTVLFQVIEWSELSAELPKLSRRMIQKEGYADLFENQKSFLRPLQVNLSHETLTPPSNMEKWVSEKWLQIYFGQLLSPHGVFLDLRPLSYQTQGTELSWQPPALWTKFSPRFHEGLMEIYDGFYFGQENTYRSGLEKIGLISSSWSEDDKTKLAELFKGQFGSSIEGETEFDLEQFKSAIVQITNFLFTRKVKITPDFLYLGVYLINLYSNLEQSKHKLDVKKNYLEVKKCLSTSV